LHLCQQRHPRLFLRPPPRAQESDALTEAILEFGKEFPSLIMPLLTERDLFMVHIMRKLAGRARSVVAVVGAGHLAGIRENWEREIDVEGICAVPPPRRPWRWGRLLLLGGGVTAVAAVAMRVRHR
jgi:pheromone shutdown protein TraB